MAFPMTDRSRHAVRLAGRRNRAAAALACAAAAAAALSSPSRAFAVPADYRLVYADEFDGTTLDTMKWNYHYTWGRTHNHRAYMEQSQVQVGNGRLNLQAIAQRSPNAPATATSGGVTYSLDYTSGAINSSGKLNLTHGFIEARIKMSDVQGSWPAFWMLQNGWPPEIDIMEFPRGANNSASQYWANYHYTNASNQHASYGWQMNTANLTTGYHEFAVEWTPTAMHFYFDGGLRHSVTDAAAIADSANQYLILNHAVGGWAGNPPSDAAFPANYEVDWVRAWQKLPSGAAATSTWTLNGGGAWDTAGNWSGVVPKYGNHVARFGAVGASSAAVTWSNSRTVGGIEFSGGASGTTAYTLGTGASSLQFANTTGGTPFIEALATGTANQSIGARVELWDTTQVRNNMATSSIFLTGPIVGAGGLLIDGPGTVVLTQASSYTGGTQIDSGTQGPGVLRALASGVLGSGGVVVGVNGNATTARLEIAGGSRVLANNIDLRGRTNNSVAIENVVGNNTFAGTVTANVGGNVYLIQSDANTLTLSGAAAGATAAGVAIQAASGDRVITLQGVGNGLVSGIVRDGGGKIGITKAGAGTWTLSGANTYTGATSVTAGKLVLGRSLTTSSALNASGTGVVEVAQDGTRVIKTPTVTVTGGARVDLKNNKLITDTPAGAASGGAYADGSVQRMVQTAYAEGAWSGGGLTTSMPDAAAGLTTIAVLTGEQYGASTFAGQSVSPTSTIVMYTYGGDTNLDGKLDADDYGTIDFSVLTAGADGYYNGDFNYDGVVNADDYGVIDFNILAQGEPFSTAAPADVADAGAGVGSVAAVPEPVSIAVMALALPQALARRRGKPGVLPRASRASRASA